MDLDAVPKRKGWSPHEPLDDKHHWHRLFVIKRDGTVVEHVLLNIAIPELREEVIATHYVQSTYRLDESRLRTHRFVSRDKPWDFSFEDSEGQPFNIEIVSVSDNQETFRKRRQEELVYRIEPEPRIPLSQLERIHRSLPHPDAARTINRARKRAMGRSELVQNPWYNPTDKPVHIFQDMLTPDDAPFSDLVTSAIQSKIDKPHQGKNHTVLIVDNRTVSFDIDDYHAMIDERGPWFDATPFLEIWLYTGYYSDLDGRNAEYSLAPLKLGGQIGENFIDELNGREPDENGIVRRSV